MNEGVQGAKIKDPTTTVVQKGEEVNTMGQCQSQEEDRSEEEEEEEGWERNYRAGRRGEGAEGDMGLEPVSSCEEYQEDEDEDSSESSSFEEGDTSRTSEEGEDENEGDDEEEEEEEDQDQIDAREQVLELIRRRVKETAARGRAANVDRLGGWDDFGYDFSYTGSGCNDFCRRTFEGRLDLEGERDPVTHTPRVFVVDPKAPRPWVREKKNLDPDGKILEETIKAGHAIRELYNDLSAGYLEEGVNGRPRLNTSTKDLREVLLNEGIWERRRRDRRRLGLEEVSEEEEESLPLPPPPPPSPPPPPRQDPWEEPRPGPVYTYPAYPPPSIMANWMHISGKNSFPPPTPYTEGTPPGPPAELQPTQKPKGRGKSALTSSKNIKKRNSKSKGRGRRTKSKTSRRRRQNNLFGSEDPLFDWASGGVAGSVAENLIPLIKPAKRRSKSDQRRSQQYKNYFLGRSLNYPNNSHPPPPGFPPKSQHPGVNFSLNMLQHQQQQIQQRMQQHPPRRMPTSQYRFLETPPPICTPSASSAAALEAEAILQYNPTAGSRHDMLFGNVVGVQYQQNQSDGNYCNCQRPFWDPSCVPPCSSPPPPANDSFQDEEIQQQLQLQQQQQQQLQQLHEQQQQLQEQQLQLQEQEQLLLQQQQQNGPSSPSYSPPSNYYHYPPYVQSQVRIRYYSRLRQQQEENQNKKNQIQPPSAPSQGGGTTGYSGQQQRQQRYQYPPSRQQQSSNTTTATTTSTGYNTQQPLSHPSPYHNGNQQHSPSSSPQQGGASSGGGYYNRGTPNEQPQQKYYYPMNPPPQPTQWVYPSTSNASVQTSPPRATVSSSSRPYNLPPTTSRPPLIQSTVYSHNNNNNHPGRTHYWQDVFDQNARQQARNAAAAATAALQQSRFCYLNALRSSTQSPQSHHHQQHNNYNNQGYLLPQPTYTQFQLHQPQQHSHRNRGGMGKCSSRMRNTGSNFGPIGSGYNTASSAPTPQAVTTASTPPIWGEIPSPIGRRRRSASPLSPLPVPLVVPGFNHDDREEEVYTPISDIENEIGKDEPGSLELEVVPVPSPTNEDEEENDEDEAEKDNSLPVVNSLLVEELPTDVLLIRPMLPTGSCESLLEETKQQMIENKRRTEEEIPSPSQEQAEINDLITSSPLPSPSSVNKSLTPSPSREVEDQGPTSTSAITLPKLERSDSLFNVFVASHPPPPSSEDDEEDEENGGIGPFRLSPSSSTLLRGEDGEPVKDD